MTVKSGTLAIGDIINAQFKGEVLLGTTSRGTRQFTGFDFGIVTYISRSEKYGTSIGVKVFDMDSTVWTIMLNGGTDVDVLTNIRDVEAPNADQVEHNDYEFDGQNMDDGDNFHISYSKLRGEVYVFHNGTDEQLCTFTEEDEGMDFGDMTSEELWWYIAKNYGGTIRDLMDSVYDRHEGVIGEC